jgi:hypothetical protein
MRVGKEIKRGGMIPQIPPEINVMVGEHLGNQLQRTIEMANLRGVNRQSRQFWSPAVLPVTRALLQPPIALAQVCHESEKPWQHLAETALRVSDEGVICDAIEHLTSLSMQGTGAQSPIGLLGINDGDEVASERDDRLAFSWRLWIRLIESGKSAVLKKLAPMLNEDAADEVLTRFAGLGPEHHFALDPEKFDRFLSFGFDLAEYSHASLPQDPAGTRKCFESILRWTKPIKATWFLGRCGGVMDAETAVFLNQNGVDLTPWWFFEWLDDDSRFTRVSDLSKLRDLMPQLFWAEGHGKNHLDYTLGILSSELFFEHSYPKLTDFCSDCVSMMAAGLQPSVEVELLNALDGGDFNDVVAKRLLKWDAAGFENASITFPFYKLMSLLIAFQSPNIRSAGTRTNKLHAFLSSTWSTH